MDRTTVRKLAELREDAAVSILCALDTRQPGNAHDVGVLAGLRDDAVDGVNRVLDGEAATSLIARIDAALQSVDLQHPTEGVAVLVSPKLSKVIPLGEPVASHVVVGERFAIRDLIVAAANSAHARVLVLSRAKTRCIDLTGDDILERLDHGFPIEISPPTEADTPHGDFPLDEHEHAEAAKFVFRAVDRALASLESVDQRPIVLVGVERDLAYFDEVTDNGARILGRLRGNHERETAVEIARLVAPVLEEHRRRQQLLACDEARGAIGAHAICGVADSWDAARAGRGHRLIVEEGYRYPARVVEGALTAAPDAPAGAIDAVSDTIGEVVRHDGDVVVVPDGSLSDLGRIALLTRY